MPIFLDPVARQRADRTRRVRRRRRVALLALLVVVVLAAAIELASGRDPLQPAYEVSAARVASS